MPVVAHDSFQQVGAAAALQLLTWVIEPVCPAGQAKVRDVEAGAGPQAGGGGAQVLEYVAHPVVPNHAPQDDQVDHTTLAPEHEALRVRCLSSYRC